MDRGEARGGSSSIAQQDARRARPDAERAPTRLLMPNAWRGRRRCFDGDETAKAPPRPELYSGAGGRRLRHGVSQAGDGWGTMHPRRAMAEARCLPHGMQRHNTRGQWRCSRSVLHHTLMDIFFTVHDQKEWNRSKNGSSVRVNLRTAFPTFASIPCLDGDGFQPRF
jgi:hypothetical protein